MSGARAYVGKTYLERENQEGETFVRDHVWLGPNAEVAHREILAMLLGWSKNIRTVQRRLDDMGEELRLCDVHEDVQSLYETGHARRVEKYLARRQTGPNSWAWISSVLPIKCATCPQ